MCSNYATHGCLCCISTTVNKKHPSFYKALSVQHRIISYTFIKNFGGIRKRDKIPGVDKIVKINSSLGNNAAPEIPIVLPTLRVLLKLYPESDKFMATVLSIGMTIAI